MHRFVLSLGWLVLPLMPSPMPRQVPSHPAGTAAEVQKGASKDKNIPPPAPIQKQPYAPAKNDTASTPASESKPRHVIIDSTPNKDTWDKVYIVLTGVLVLIGAGTLIAIFKQAKDTARSADAARRSVELQEVLNRQWIDIEDHEATEISRWGGKEMSVGLSFAIFNNTRMPLTLCSVRFQIGSDHHSSSTMQYLIAPDNGYTVDYVLPLSGERLAHYQKHELILVVTGHAGFIDAFEKKREQPFGFVCKCGTANYFEISQHPGLPQEEPGQNPN